MSPLMATKTMVISTSIPGRQGSHLAFAPGFRDEPRVSRKWELPLSRGDAINRIETRRIAKKRISNEIVYHDSNLGRALRSEHGGSTFRADPFFRNLRRIRY